MTFEEPPHAPVACLSALARGPLLLSRQGDAMPFNKDKKKQKKAPAATPAAGVVPNPAKPTPAKGPPSWGPPKGPPQGPMGPNRQQPVRRRG